jgi:transglutaminase-like putative cysteine protease
MIKLKLAVELNYDISPPGCDFIFNIHAARTPSQQVIEENLQISQPVTPELYDDSVSGNRLMRFTAMPGLCKVRYGATVELTHYATSPEQLMEVPVAHLPAEILHYIYPSRYCQSDRLRKLAIREFGQLWQGCGRVQAIQEWVRQRVTFSSQSSNASTSAIDTLIEQVGVCRDFAHLMIALCRAINIPARFATGIDYGADPGLGPTDFHAYVEVFLGDRWYIFDPSGIAVPMGFVRFGTGRDAADASFATIFGTVTSSPPVISIAAVTEEEKRFVTPYHCKEILSTDGGFLV